MSFDADQLGRDIVAALRGELKGGWKKVSSFATRQARGLSAQAALIARERTIGSLRHDDQLYEFFVGNLREMTENFARTLAALTLLTIERAWNAVAGLLWGAINGALEGAGLGVLALPKVPKAQ